MGSTTWIRYDEYHDPQTFQTRAFFAIFYGQILKRTKQAGAITIGVLATHSEKTLLANFSQDMISTSCAERTRLLRMGTSSLPSGNLSPYSQLRTTVASLTT